jgi:predicted deacylase
LHTAASHRDNLPQIRANLDDAQTRDLATSFGVPVLINAAERDGSLRASASEKGVKTLLYEAGEALRFSELGIRIGVLGILRVMRFIGMLPPGRSNTKGTENPFIARSSSWIRASATGVVTLQAKLGEVIEANEIVARIYDPYDYFETVSVEVRAPHAGLIIGLTKNPLVYEGDALMHVARFHEPLDVATEVEMLRDDLLQDP